MEIPEHRQMTADTYAHDHPDRLEALNDPLAALKTNTSEGPRQAALRT
jgi:hypothetical protein